MGLINGRFLPLVYGILSDKKEETYMRFLEELPINNQTAHIIVDFERALMNAIENVAREIRLIIEVIFLIVLLSIFL